MLRSLAMRRGFGAARCVSCCIVEVGTHGVRPGLIHALDELETPQRRWLVARASGSALRITDGCSAGVRGVILRNTFASDACVPRRSLFASRRICCTSPPAREAGWCFPPLAALSWSDSTVSCKHSTQCCQMLQILAAVAQLRVPSSCSRQRRCTQPVSPLPPASSRPSASTAAMLQCCWLPMSTEQRRSQRCAPSSPRRRSLPP